MIKFDFHVTKIARNKYQFEESLFSIHGDLIIANFRQARILTNKINEQRKKEGAGDKLVTAGSLNALGLIHEILHYLIRIYEDQENPGIFNKALINLKKNFSGDELDKIFLQYLNEFPPLEVYRNKISAEEYLNGKTETKPNREIILEELLLLNIENNNPATVLFEELYSDKNLAKKSRYIESLDIIERFFITEKPFGVENLPLVHFLRKPIINSPYDIEGQLQYIIEKWGVYIYEKFNDRLLRGVDLIKEDVKLFLQHGGGEKATPPVPKYEFDEEYFRKLQAKLAAGQKLSDDELDFYHSEVERFTEDVDWMPRVVMLAKNTYVWLDQLSKKYQRSITKLDQIPDEELDNLARWNFTALWLIGIWERSNASRKIKQMTGNPEAVSSAYSLYDYVIADDFGGEAAFENLKSRAWQRGIRVASDMVPNHTGIFSKWVIDKPNYFLHSDYPPYPGYTFNGPNLSDDDRVEIRIEDKYYSKSDAAVVFERKDSYTGERKYIYHGNDGTNMPWNDTAQLDLLNPEVRESLIQTILHVARKFPIIRFDAAMTLAKKHYQRLWFPQPGTGGAIPSRSDYAMTREAFNNAMPVEFWREVVDRINTELPNTLLLAEAFWLMEGYFVRTLGMHRVYNSAFMHMLMKEENNKYRELIKNTLEFNPEILKRYVNFMSNPDEETALNQFGKGDKYFGVAMLMVTLPGLPMFGHGQVEGFSEKYGMEYRKAYYNESVDDSLVRRHEGEIFPLMGKRHLFSQVTNFEFYDFINHEGNVNENVFAYTNKAGSEKVLVVYNNSYYECSGTINYSNIKNSENGNTTRQKIASALDLKPYYNFYYIFKDHRTKLEYIISGQDVNEEGLSFSLQGYQYLVCLDFREVYDSNGEYNRLYKLLRHRGVPSIEEALKELKLTPVHQALSDLFNPDDVSQITEYCFEQKKQTIKSQTNISIPFDFEGRINHLISEVNKFAAASLDFSNVYLQISNDLNAVKIFNDFCIQIENRKNSPKWFKNVKLFITLLNKEVKHQKEFALVYFVINRIVNFSANDSGSENLFSKLMLRRSCGEIFEILGHPHDSISTELDLLEILTTPAIQNYLRFENGKEKHNKIIHEEEVILNSLGMQDVKNYLSVNDYQGVTYFSKESLENLVRWLFTLKNIQRIPQLILNNVKTQKETKDKIKIEPSVKGLTKELSDFLKKSFEKIEKILSISKNSGYQLKIFEEEIINLQKEEATKKPSTKKSKSKKKLV